MSALCIVLICIGCFVAGGTTIVLLTLCLSNKGKKKKVPKHAVPKEKKRLGTMNLILAIIGITLAAFTVCMIDLFKNYGNVPDTLITCVFAALAGECGIMGWIKTTKDRKRDREWQLEDEKRAKEEQKEKYSS